MIVYEDESDEKKYIEQAIRSGVPIGRVELILLLAAYLEKKPLDIQDIWMDVHIGVQQVFLKKEF